MRQSSYARAATAALLALAGVAHAAFPEKPIRVIVPTAIGGPSDLCIRTVGEAMARDLGQQLVIENVTGATDNIGLERVAARSTAYSSIRTTRWIWRCCCLQNAVEKTDTPAATLGREA